MLYAELGRFPLKVIIKSRMIGFWNRLITGKQEKFSYKIYQAIMNIVPGFQSKWVNEIQNILTETGNMHLWNNQQNIHQKNIKHIIKQTLIDQYYQNWNQSLQHSSKGRNYSIFKSSVSLDNYLQLLGKKHYIPLAKYRTGNHHLPIEVGRWENIDISERKCTLCNKNDTGDEMHYLLICPFFTQYRIKHVKRYYYTHPNILKFQQLMCSVNKQELVNLSCFVKTIMNAF